MTLDLTKVKFTFLWKKYTLHALLEVIVYFYGAKGLHINELATSVKRQTTNRYDIDKIKIRKDLAF